ncbi:MAG: FtsX-like permease family protein, partial [Candidatus Binatia bacterium]
TGLFATAAGLLAAVGLYGVVAYSTGRRTREIGVRMALGADATSIRGMIVRSGLITAATGLLLGAVGSLAVARALRALLYGSSPADPGMFALVAGLLLVSSFVASYLPSRRATRLSPLAALREA